MFDKIRSFLMVMLLFSISFPMSSEAQDFERTFLSSTMPPYGAPPYRYEGSRLISITFETAPEILRALVPELLAVDEGNLMSITIGLQKIVEPGPTDYYEAYISIPVSHDGTRGTYLPILYLDKAMPIVGGREIWGFSKVDAEIHFEEADGKIYARVIQDGTTLINAVMSLGEQLVPPENSPSQPMFNMKLIPSVKKDALPDVMQLTSMTPRDEKVTKLRSGEATLVLVSTPFSPLGKIPVRKITDCLYTESGFIMDYGEVVHDYLAGGSAKNDPTLIAHWPLDEAQGSMAYNIAANCDGTLMGDPIWQPNGGVVGGTLLFDGIDDYVCTDFVQKPSDGSFSAFAWIKGGTPGQVIISQVDRSAGRTTMLGSTWLGTDLSNGKLVTTLMDQPFGPLESQVIITDGLWHHIGLVYALDGLQRRLYVDGVEVAGDTAFVEGVLSDGGLHFGTGKYLSTTSFWLGLIDDIRIYSMALTADEIAALVQ
ncbi:acetoacetate decarboxylase family protein [Planctomycetota bacterium]